MTNQQPDTGHDKPANGDPSSEGETEGEPASESENETDTGPFSDMNVITMRDLLKAQGKLDSSSDGEST